MPISMQQLIFTRLAVFYRYQVKVKKKKQRK